MKKMQTLSQAIHLVLTGKDRALARRLNYLDGCPDRLASDQGALSQLSELQTPIV
jgi:hypothetical protein